MNRTAYCIDFKVNGRGLPLASLEVCEYDGRELLEELRAYRVDDPEELTDYDRIVFNSEADADLFLQYYRDVYEQLVGGADFCISRGFPALGYYRHNLIQTLMGFKLQTYRGFKKPWKPGQLFNLHDRTHFVTVELLSVHRVSRSEWCYRFKLPPVTQQKIFDFAFLSERFEGHRSRVLWAAHREGML